MLDLKAIFYLGEAVRHGTIRAAADSLDIEPSSISRSISRLEKSLDIALVERNRRGVRVTEAGEAILRYYRAAGQQEEAILGEIEELRGLRRGVVSVVIGEGFLADFLSERTAEFFADFPGISIDLELAGTNDIVRKIVDDEADIGIVFNPPKEPRVSVVAEVKEPLCAVMPAGHALAGRRRLSLADTTAYPVALLRPSFGIRQILSEAETKHGIHLSAGLVTDSIAALKNFVRAGFGLTYLPKFSVVREIGEGVFKAVPLTESELREVTAEIIVRNGRLLSPSAQRFLSHITQTMVAFSARRARP